MRQHLCIPNNQSSSSRSSRSITATRSEKPAPIGSRHYEASNTAHSFRFARALAVEKAVLDPRLAPKDIRVLAAIAYHMNEKTRRAWPSYERISQIVGYTPEVIERAIKILLVCGYIFRDRHAPITGGRAVVHYGLGAVGFDDIEEVVTAAVMHL
ncbi:MAG TPA: helix-turn-helix domain-containing protein, partial [Hyphomicrobium sp.]|nr:helix-turn-helix domain-containing protein [Hyphomicrobium sp.]